MTRRTSVRCAAAAAVMMSALAANGQPPPVMDVTLLGTGSPLPIPSRFGPSTLVEAGADKLLFDCGRGCSIRLFQKGITLRDVKLFLTHLHSDHTSGIPDLWLTGWLPMLHGSDLKSKPLYVAGPEGTKAMMDHLKEAYAGDIALMAAGAFLGPLAADVQDIGAGVVYNSDGITVTAFEVDHGTKLAHTYGYRVDYRGRSVVISGDTRFNENVIKYGSDADVLIHEVAMVKDQSLARTPVVSTILAIHTSPADAGRVFSAAHPRLAVLTHFTVAGQAGVNAPSGDDFVAAARTTYAGPLEAGEDLMTIHVGDTITVDHPGTHVTDVVRRAAARN